MEERGHAYKKHNEKNMPHITPGIDSSASHPSSSSASSPSSPAAPDNDADSGLICLAMLARLHGVAVDPDHLAHVHRSNGQAMNKTDMLLAAKQLGLQAKIVAIKLDRLEKTPLPAIAVGRDGRFFIIARAEAKQVLIQDPAVNRPESLAIDVLTARWDGELMLFTSRATFANEMSKFDFTWFIPAIVKYRKLLSEVLLVSLVLQCFALVTPLFFQVVMDKVLVHRGFTTLDVIAAGLIGVVIFEVALNALRSYVFAHTTSRIDVELGARLFRHLLALPLDNQKDRKSVV